MVRLNLGSGDKVIEGYENLDGAEGDEIYPLAYSQVDVIRASHILEHFGRIESVEVLKDWVSSLKDGGLIKIAVPDFPVLLDMCTTHPVVAENMEAFIMGGQIDGRDYHKSIWDRNKLSAIMGEIGLKDIKEWTSEIDDCASYPFSLNLQGRK